MLGATFIGNPNPFTQIQSATRYYFPYLEAGQSLSELGATFIGNPNPFTQIQQANSYYFPDLEAGQRAYLSLAPFS
jgi:hypothetical protein